MNETSTTWTAPTHRRGMSKGLAIGTLGSHEAQTTYIQQTLGGPITLRTGLIETQEPRPRNEITTADDIETLAYHSDNGREYQCRTVYAAPHRWGGQRYPESRPKRGNSQQSRQMQNRDLPNRDLTIYIGLFLVGVAILYTLGFMFWSWYTLTIRAGETSHVVAQEWCLDVEIPEPAEAFTPNFRRQMNDIVPYNNGNATFLCDRKGNNDAIARSDRGMEQCKV